MIGQRFGKLIVIEVAPRPASRRERGKFYLCACDCGGETVAYGGHLRHGSRKACGCVKPAPRTHGLSKTPEYAIWANAKDRCERQGHAHYADYGGRGIAMAPEWASSFERFLSDMGPRPTPAHSLDRQDNDGDYTPGNCRWATRSEQQSNRRNNRLIALGGQQVTVAEAARRTGIPHQTILGRLRAGWPDHLAIRAEKHTQINRRGANHGR